MGEQKKRGCKIEKTGGGEMRRMQKARGVSVILGSQPCGITMILLAEETAPSSDT